MPSEDRDVLDYAAIALSLIGTAARLYPELKGWLHDITDGKTDVLSVRVRQILGDESESAKALRELG